MSVFYNLDDRQQDILREVGNVGAGHAATALSVLLQESVQMSVTAARLCPFDEIADIAGGPEAPVVGIFLQIGGQMNGSMFLLLPMQSAEHLLHQLNLTGHEGLLFEELQLSALAEVGNILSGSYVTAISELASLQITLSVPSIAVDMAGAILDIGLAFSGDIADQAILINTQIWQGQMNIDGHFFLLPHPQSMVKLFSALGWDNDV
ncbi:chemotaxis protein CheC [Alicyclobacillus tolerans]|uniref:Chemotaxis protein CheC n=3 Tax=Alicyclobacillus TaxID=29330 RepID=A0A1M6RMB0_9BACL|nr:MULTISPECIES: chemotaxis protein CheC [Alicyclobacillus]MDP9728867.1 chemotaxis protein CheC [Alicyclobacillus tengchongensis]SHK33595.1 chemotaxis protein CheC [Alicyclobacillus montanus]